MERSDVKAKKEFKEFLKNQGFRIEAWDKGKEEGNKCPADIYASKDGKMYLFEIKATTIKKDKRIFWACS